MSDSPIQTQKTQATEQWVKVDVVATYLGVARGTVYRWVRQGLPARRIGSVYRFRLSEVDQWVTDRRVTVETKRSTT